MSDCLHCQTNDLVEQQIAGGENDPLALASKIVTSVADLILNVPQLEQALMIEEVLSQFGHVMLEKSGVTTTAPPSPRIDGRASGRTPKRHACDRRRYIPSRFIEPG